VKHWWYIQYQKSKFDYCRLLYFKKSLHERADNDLNTLRRVLSQKEQESQQKQFRLESRIHELEDLQQSLKSITVEFVYNRKIDNFPYIAGLTNINSSDSSVSPHPPAPTPSNLPPPPPPLPTSMVPAPPPLSNQLS